MSNNGDDNDEFHPLLQGMLGIRKWTVELEEGENVPEKGTRPGQFLARRKMSPLEALIIEKANLQCVKRMYKLCPEALTPGLCKNAARCGYPSNLEELLTKSLSDDSEESDEESSSSHPFFSIAKTRVFSIPEWDYDSDSSFHMRELPEQDLYPLELLVVCKANLYSIQKMFHLFPEALTGVLLRNALRYGCQPGVVGFFVDQNPSVVIQDCLYFAVSRGPDPHNQPTEQDIKKLAAANPGQVLTRCHAEHNGYTPLEVALQRDCFSTSLLGFFAQSCLSADTDSSLDHLHLYDSYCGLMASYYVDHENCIIIEGADVANIRAISPLISKAKSIWARLQECWRNGAKGAELFCCLLEMNNLKDLEIVIPEDFENYVGIESQASHLDLVQPLLARSGIQMLEISGSVGESRFRYQRFLESLDYGVAQMPQLEELRVDLSRSDHLQQVVPVLCELVGRKETKLKLLEISTWLATADHGDLYPLLEALASNKENSASRLKHFRYRKLDGHNQTQNEYPERKLYEDFALKMLKNSNMALEAASFRRSTGNTMLKYYSDLNTCGRKKVTKSSATVADLVGVLLSTPKEEELYCRWGDCMLGLQYGLLRESPSVWCNAGQALQGLSKAISKPRVKRMADGSTKQI